MIDIHSHIIFNVDDGSKSLEQSIKELKQIKKIGLEEVICTPHMKSGNIDKIMKIKENYSHLVEEANKLGIKLYLGNEIMYSEKMLRLLKNNRLLTLNNSKYILLEFRRNERMDISNVIATLDEVIEAGYKPILAHPELYINYRNIDDIIKIKETGTLLQMDATSIVKGKSDRKVYKFSKKLLKERLIDIVSSDAHCTKKRNHITYKKAYKKVARKYTKKYADILFKENAKMIVGC